MTLLPLATVGAAWLVSGLAFAVATTGTPGPNNTMLAASGSLWGFRRTVPHMLGISLGFPLMIVLVAAGPGRLLAGEPLALTLLRWVGSAYLLYLAWRIARARMHADDDTHGPRARSRPLRFWQAALFQWVNPKAWLIAVSALATFISTAHHPSTARAVLLAVLFASVTLPMTALWTSVGVGVSRVLRTPHAIHRFNVAMGALLAASVALILTGVA